MQTNSAYASYLASMQNYETTQGRKDYQAPFASDFEAIYNQPYDFNTAYTGDKSTDSTQERSSEIEKFLYDLRTKGASQFLADLNQEKIDKLVEEYKQKLLDSMGDSPEAKLEITKLVAAFKKELIEAMQERMQDEAKKKKENSTVESKTTSVQEILTIKQQSSEIMSKKKETPLETTLKEIKTPEEIIAQYRAMPGQGGIAYEGMFEEQQAVALAKHEPYFLKEYENYEKYKDIFTPMYSNYTTQKANNIGRELNAQFPEFQAMREKAYMGGTQQDKEAFEDMFWDYQAYNKYLREKYDMDMGFTSGGGYSQESTKAYNFAVYESLESGLSIEEATQKAQSLLSSFGGNEAHSFALMFFSGLPEDIEAATKIPQEEIDYNKQIDLSDYGIEHNFWSDAYLNTYGNDSVGVKSKIMYDIKLYSFLLENDALIDTKLDELKTRAYESESGKEWYDWRNEDGKFNERFKSSFQTKYDNALYAKEIYDKYADKIFENF